MDKIFLIIKDKEKCEICNIFQYTLQSFGFKTEYFNKDKLSQYQKNKVIICLPDNYQDKEDFLATLAKIYNILVFTIDKAINIKKYAYPISACFVLPMHYNTFIHTIKTKFNSSISESKDFSKKLSLAKEKIIGNSKHINELCNLIAKISYSSLSTVLICGQTGTGKGVIAKTIHETSTCNKNPFVAVNCGAIPENLLESELFGHEKGAFTGAFQAKPGKFEAANNGSIFLDEIGDMPMNMQVKVLRVLQEKTIERVGGNKSIHINTRIIAATHRNLEKLIAEGKFRSDLYYRLNIIPIYIKPLHEHIEDLPLLIDNFKKNNNIQLDLLPQTIRHLMQYTWPGNIRELHNLIERLQVFYPNQIISLNELPNNYKKACFNFEEQC